MTSNDSRQNSRRQSERRSKERRVITYSFGSSEWLNAIQQEYLLCPKQDRRHQDRRSQDRRKTLRRVNNMSRIISPRHTQKWHNLLTIEEKQMLNDLIQDDIKN